MPNEGPARAAQGSKGQRASMAAQRQTNQQPTSTSPASAGACMSQSPNSMGCQNGKLKRPQQANKRHGQKKKGELRPVGINLLDSKADAVLAAGLRDHDDVHVGVSYSTEEGAGCSWHPHHAGSLHAPSSAIRAQTLVPFSFLNRTDRQTDRHTDRRTGSGRPDKPEPW
ncbi:MAG: hypothetical protein FRX49_02373 [Trebouxia sp. A1-2]|nr:MAG: hypothetical protein FRX49_02373 [Trebouxia sp. A1-2]